MTGWMIVVTAIATGIPSLAKMVEGIVRLRVMQKIIKVTIEKCGQGEIPNALHALAEVGSSLASETGQGTRLLGLRYLRRRSIDQRRST
jgi:hypothetical protein